MDSLFSSRWSIAAAVAVLVLMAVGCGDGGPAMAPASGVVLYNGEPLVNANVMFMAEGGGPASVGRTGSDGRFKLTTSVKPGAVVGKHRVTVQALETYRHDGKEITREELEAEPGPEAAFLYGHRWLIPQKYGNYLSSGLDAEVTRDARQNDFKFELTGPPMETRSQRRSSGKES